MATRDLSVEADGVGLVTRSSTMFAPSVSLLSVAVFLHLDLVHSTEKLHWSDLAGLGLKTVGQFARR